jgi:hypothetical protein
MVVVAQDGQADARAIALTLSGGTLFAMAVLAVNDVVARGHSYFFREGDSYMFRATAYDPFGRGHAFAAVNRLAEVPYRYGRIGFPLLGWLFGFGHRVAIDWVLIGVFVLSIAALPGLAALLLDAHGLPAWGGAAVLLAPGLVLSHSVVTSDPVMLAFVLAGLLLDKRGNRVAALAFLALAILVKEVAILALVPWAWRAFRTHDSRRLGALGLTVLPYACWCLWVRVRIGQFPFLAHTVARSQALGWPGSGIHAAFAHHTPDYALNSLVVVTTFVVGLVAAWVARDWFPVAGITCAYAVLTACVGPSAVYYEGELLRVLIAPQVFALLCIVYATSRAARRRRSLSPEPVGSMSPSHSPTG